MQGEARRREIHNCMSVMTACFSPDELWDWFSTELAPPESIHALWKEMFLKIISANAEQVKTRPYILHPLRLSFMGEIRSGYSC